MSEPDYDDPAVEDQWCREQQFAVADYLHGIGLVPGRIDDEPSFFVAPHVSVWGVCSAANPGLLAWWVILGDLPSDYLAADQIRNARDALRAFGERWCEVAACMFRGQSHPTMRLGDPRSWPKLAPMLESRAQTLIGWADDDACWEC